MRHAPVPLMVDGRVVERLESCHSVWYFDVDARQFIRVPKCAGTDPAGRAGAWEEYLELELRPGGSFVVTIGRDGTRRLRAWRHLDPCGLCSAQPTGEMPVVRVAEARG